MFSNEPVSKCSRLFKVKEEENFNHRHMLSILKLAHILSCIKKLNINHEQNKGENKGENKGGKQMAATRDKGELQILSCIKNLT